MVHPKRSTTYNYPDSTPQTSSTMASPVGPKCTSMTRVTREGRKLTYQLQVMQQPERARACGSGAKSSADRRPVDPPPVVELRIFEGESMTDVTFSLNANFLLYTTLEAARPIASGRVQQPQASFPVLTGIPVSSMSYLDRPTPAGYFIFPDLSVRHEGKYKLAFNLYEEVKESKDADPEPAASHVELKPQQPMAPKEHYHWRLDVQSQPFTVFSAKKFPGLAESTALSRIVAEQGCRVRIRRDVRMRRRENKAGQDFEEFDEDRAYMNKETLADNYHQSSMPNVLDQGARHSSVSTSHSHHSSPYEADRRSSLHEQSYYPHQQYQQGYQGPAPTSGAATSHMGYGAPAQQHFSAQYPIATSPTQHAPTYSEGQYAYAHASPPSHTYADRQPVANGHGRVESTDHKVHEWRQSQQYQAPYQPKPVNYAYSPPPFPSTYMNNPTPGTPTPDEVSNALPPLKMPLPMEPNVDGASAPSSRHHSLPSPGLEMDAGRPSQPTYQSDIAKSLKRTFASVFETAHFDQSLTNGCRPSEAHHGVDYSHADQDEDDYDDVYSMSRLKLQYKRADGTEISRRLTAVM